MTMKGAFVAATVAGMFASAVPAVSLAADTGGVHCAGANSCKGKSECKSAGNGCSSVESVSRGPSWFQNGTPSTDHLLHNIWNLSPWVPAYSLGQHFLGGLAALLRLADPVDHESSDGPDACASRRVHTGVRQVLAGAGPPGGSSKSNGPLRV